MTTSESFSIASTLKEMGYKEIRDDAAGRIVELCEGIYFLSAYGRLDIFRHAWGSLGGMYWPMDLGEINNIFRQTTGKDL